VTWRRRYKALVASDGHERELEEEYRRYFPAGEKPRPSFVRRVVGTILAIILALLVALIIFDVGCGALWKLVERAHR
jgi:hypothetical protein